MREQLTERLEAPSGEALRTLVERRTAELRAEGYLRLAALWQERPRGLLDRLLRRPAVRAVELRFARDGSLGTGAGEPRG
jgi:hypothetical protein